MKRNFLTTLVLALLFPAAGLWAATNAVFTSVTGKVEVKDAQGKNTRAAEKDAAVVEGEHISAGPDSQATLRLFDGSKVDISPNTAFVLEKMQQPSLQDKVFQFKLELGKLFATVKKLASSKSSFEIEAGGVVCGVRGTEYTMEYNPSTGKVDVLVLTGTVWSTSNGQTQVLQGGQGGSWSHGSWTPHQPPTGGNPPPTTNNDHHPGFIASNPFYGFNGTGSDDFNNHLTNLPSGLPGITGNLGNNGVAGLAAHVNLNIQLKFPQYLPLP